MDDFKTSILIETYAAALAMLGTFVVAIVVFWLTRGLQRESFDKEAERATQAREEEDRRRQAAIRLALNFEVENNLAALRVFWGRVAGPGGSVEAIGRRLLNAPVPIWDTGVWQGATAFVVLAPGREELIATYTVYSTFGEILGVQGRLQAASQRDMAEYAADPGTAVHLGRPELGMHKSPVTHNFDTAAKTLVPDIDAKVRAILGRGNPVPVAPGASESPVPDS